MNISLYLHPRKSKYYPRTTVAIPDNDAPPGHSTIDGQYGWWKRCIDSTAKLFGRTSFQARLKKVEILPASSAGSAVLRASTPQDRDLLKRLTDVLWWPTIRSLRQHLGSLNMHLAGHVRSSRPVRKCWQPLMGPAAAQNLGFKTCIRDLECFGRSVFWLMKFRSKTKDIMQFDGSKATNYCCRHQRECPTWPLKSHKHCAWA